MSDETIDRAVQMLKLAAQWAYDNVSIGSKTIHYDGAECDGYCLADDCEAAANDLLQERAK